MTIKEFLALPPEQQTIEAAKVLVPKPWKHDWAFIEEYTYKCLKCDKVEDKSSHILKTPHWDMVSEFGFPNDSDCFVPAPPPIDWNNAKRLQGECVASQIATHTFSYCLHLVFVTGGYSESWIYNNWLIYGALPIHYIAACMAAKGGLK